MPDKTVGDLMHKGIIACRPDTPMTEVVRIVLDTDVHAIVVMDDQQRSELSKRFPKEYLQKRIPSLDIQDVYGYRQPELVELLKERMASLVEPLL